MITYSELHASIPRPTTPLIHKLVQAVRGGEFAGHWLIPINVPNVGDWLHFAPTSTDQAKSEGYGGATLSFKLDNGSEIKVRGPWHGNSKSLWSDTGIDVRDLHYTRVAIGLTRVGWPECRDVVGGLEEALHIDATAVLGDFDRHKALAQQLANLYAKQVYVIAASSGGGQGSHVKPNMSYYACAGLTQEVQHA
jgi:hypothetical protein